MDDFRTICVDDILFFHDLDFSANPLEVVEYPPPISFQVGVVPLFINKMGAHDNV